MIELKIAVHSLEHMDKNAWTVLENLAVHMSVFQTQSWAKVMKSIGTEPRFLTLTKNDEPLLGLLMLKSHFILRMFQGYEARGGPLCAHELDVSALPTFLSTLKSIIKKESTLYFYWATPFFPRPEPPICKQIFLSLPAATFVIDLSLPLKTLWKKLEKKARWGVGKAQKMGVTVSEATNWEDWRTFYSLYEYEHYRKGARPHSLALHKSMYKYLLHENKVKLFLAKHERKTIAGGLFLVSPHEMIYYEGASDARYLSFEPNNAIQWHALSWAKEHGVRYYDLGGTIWNTDEKSFLYGVHRFKRRWGGELRRFNSLALNKLFVIGREIFFNSSKIRRLYYASERLGIVRRSDRI